MFNYRINIGRGGFGGFGGGGGCGGSSGRRLRRRLRLGCSERIVLKREADNIHNNHEHKLILTIKIIACYFYLFDIRHC